jgi:uncharacterized protein DUF429
VGLALVSFDHGRLQLEAAELGRSESGLVETVARWLTGCDQALIAIDAPLGWPSALGGALSRHQAGGPLVDEAHQLFRRDTDRFIKARIGKQSLDVGADRIARTAFAALGLLSRLRQRLADDIPLAWTPSDLPRWSAIEVYPAATLRAHNISEKGYKDAEAIEPRLEILRRLRFHHDMGSAAPLLERSPDALDALVCTLAGMDFLSGIAMPPENLIVAQREGWIWARDPSAGCECQTPNNVGQHPNFSS